MAHLTAEDKAAFKENGYLVKHDMLTEQQIQDGLDVLWENIEADRHDPETWVNAGPRNPKCGGHPAIRGTLHDSPIFEMAEELVGKGRLNENSGPGPKMNYPTGKNDWSPPSGGHLDGYYTPSNGVAEDTVGKFMIGATIYMNHIQHQGGGFTVWPGTHRMAGEYFKNHAINSIKGGSGRRVFDLPEHEEITGPPGTVCLWHGQLVHSVSRNCAREIRMALIARLRRTDNNDILFETPDDIWEHYEGIDGG